MKGRRREGILWVRLAFLQVGILISGPVWAAGSAAVVLVAPPPDTPLFGSVEVEVEVSAQQPILRVDLLLDGRLAGSLAQAPYRFTLEVGDENRRHRIEAVAHGADGPLGRAHLESPAVRLDEVVDLQLQQVYVTVTNRRGRRVLDLERSAFKLRDDRIEQRIVTFESGDIPFTAVLLLDASHSMRGGRLPAAVRGAQAFLAGMKDHDEASVMVFSDHLLEISSFAGPGAASPVALDRAAASGGTAVNDQLFLALRRLEVRQGRRVVVLLSDGDDVHSVLQSVEIEQVARLSQAQIYWLRLDSGGHQNRTQHESWHDPQTSAQALRRLGGMVKKSGGRVLKIDRTDAIEAAFADVLRELREQYALGYYPSHSSDDGSWHSWQLELPPRLRGRAGAGYVDY